ncbi:MAG: hypothetical protein ABJC88_16800 [Parasphingorhabdus sp.]|uniref:hypothetical protein n=1 Tax=Sphingomonadales TaxID=204457 RepID=UPI003265B560
MKHTFKSPAGTVRIMDIHVGPEQWERVTGWKHCPNEVVVNEDNSDEDVEKLETVKRSILKGRKAKRPPVGDA